MRTAKFQRAVLFFLGFALLGCVERTMTIKSEPPEARVYLDGKETGRTPVTVPFHWYGYREIALEKDGYEIEREVVQVKPPLYQVFPLDFVFDVLIPLKFHDRHDFSYTLRPKQYVEPEKVVERAREMGQTVHPQVPKEE